MTATSRVVSAAAALLAGCSVLPDPSSPPGGPAALARAETAFAAQSVREGMRAAFLTWLAPEATLFRDGPVNGPAYVAANPDPPIILDWRPVFVEVAAGGDLGLSTGPWTLTSRKNPSALPRHGQFVSIWKRVAGGPWRVQVDLGISHPTPALATVPLLAVTTPASDARLSATLLEAEAGFAQAAVRAGDAAAYASSVSGSVRLYRNGHEPFLGREAALASPAARAAHTVWTLESHEMSASGDFGYATGRFGPAENHAPAGHYLRAWRREPGGWRIALDVVNELASR